MKKITCAAITLLSLSTNLFAAPTAAITTTDANTTASTSFKDYYKTLKDSPVGLLILSETVAKRKINGLGNETILYLDYKLGKNKFTVAPSFGLDTTTTAGEAHIEYGYTQLRYTRTELMTQAEEGVDLQFQLRGYISNDNSRLTGNETTLRPKLVLSKTWGKFSLTSDNSIYLYQNNENITDESKTTRVLIGLTPAYQVTDKLSLSLDILDYNERFEKDAQSIHKVRTIANVGYSFDNGIGLTGYLDTTPLTSKGQNVTATNTGWIKKTSLGAVLTYKVF